MIRHKTQKEAEPTYTSIEKIVTELQRRGIGLTDGGGTGARLDHARTIEHALSHNHLRARG